MWRSIDSTARREATSPAACPPMPSATTNRLCSGASAKESSLDERLRPTSDRPALWNRRPGVSGTVLPLRPVLVALRPRELLQLGAGRLVRRLARQDDAQLVHRFLLPAAVGQRERQVQAGDLVVRVPLEGAAEGGGRLVPALELAQRDAEIVVHVGEGRVELDGLPEVLDRRLELPVLEQLEAASVVELEVLRTPLERLAHPLLGLRDLAAVERLARLAVRLLDRAHRQVARRGELRGRLRLLAVLQQKEGEVHPGLEVVGVDRERAAVRFHGLQTEVEPGVERAHAEVDVGVVGGQLQ